ncbi:germ cell nuclear acidic protein-like [Diretmus argenteus]
MGVGQPCRAAKKGGAHILISSDSDGSFETFLVESATPKAKATSQKPCRAAKKGGAHILISSDSDGSFETFLERVKTPTVKPKKTAGSGSEDSLKNFIVDDYSSDDDFIEKKPSSRDSKNAKHPTTQPPVRRPLSQCDSPVFISDDDGGGGIVVKSTWRTRHPRTQLPPKANKINAKHSDQESPSPSPVPSLRLPTSTASTPSAIPKRTCSAPSMLDDSGSSDDGLISLLEKRSKKPPVSVPPVKGQKAPGARALGQTTLDVNTPGKFAIPRPTVSQTEPRPGHSSKIVCKTPGCFLQSLSAPGTSYGQNFKRNKEELTSKLYRLYNTSVFDSKLPANMSVTWNKKMRKTAGYCVTGQERGGGNRYARIELSEKVCDSADRLRDTLVHEMCHAATWLINGVRDGHGSFWKLYARKATLAHPELPMVTRCHSYDIKYKFQYQCTRCQNTIGRHSKSLDTQRFMCAFCMGQLVLLTPSKPRAPTAFANFVKENYGNVRQQLVGQSHTEVMRKLSADFATKTKLSQS